MEKTKTNKQNTTNNNRYHQQPRSQTSPLPAGQVTQATSESEPLSGLNVPAGQAWKSLPSHQPPLAQASAGGVAEVAPMEQV